MCGICGFYNISDRINGTSILETMALSLAHRGPDGMGMWLTPDRSCGLANTRLAVIDIDGGKQPIHSSDGRFVIVSNGEIYNYKSIRSELESMGHYFRTHSDTEVLLEAYKQWGKMCLDRIHGMFAFAIYDVNEHELFMARDRTGIKPFYYYAGNNGFYFGSELKAILSCEENPRRINFKALSDFFVLGYPLLPSTFFSDIYELEPGTWLKLSSKGIHKGRFWKWDRISTDWNEHVALENTVNVLTKSLQEHLVSDVPIGAFLSGGIDSSLLVAMLTNVLGKDIETFNVAFGESAFDESGAAREVAKHLGARHHEIVVDMSTPDIALVDNILLHFDQPFGDSSAIPTFLICREIRKHFKVAISGDGGDEMFGGYKRFRYADIAKRIGAMPDWSIKAFRQVFEGLQGVTPGLFRQGQRMLQAALFKNDRRFLTLSYLTSPNELGNIFLPSVLKEIDGYVPSLSISGNRNFNLGGAEFIDSTIQHTLPTKYLRKVDMMSNAHGLEVRVPFLGEHVLEHAARIPHKLKISRKGNKLLLRTLAKRYLPKQIVEKPKAGFDIPLDSWLGMNGRKEIQTVLNSPNARIRELIQQNYIESLLNNFVRQELDQTKLSRYNLYQQVYFLWSLERWLVRWGVVL